MFAKYCIRCECLQKKEKKITFLPSSFFHSPPLSLFLLLWSFLSPFAVNVPLTFLPFFLFFSSFLFSLFLSSQPLRKGISGSSAPYKKAPPSWVKQKPNDVVELVCRLARKGNTPSAIGALLRDGSGIPMVKSVTGKKITRILKVLPIFYSFLSSPCSPHTHAQHSSHPLLRPRVWLLLSLRICTF